MLAVDIDQLLLCLLLPRNSPKQSGIAFALYLCLKIYFALQSGMNFIQTHRMHNIILIPIIFSFTFVQAVVAQDYPFDFSSKQYSEGVHTVLLHPRDEPLLDAVMKLGEQNALELSFDVLGDLAYIYNYTIIHCDYLWRPSDLLPAQYISGYFEDEIRDYRFSLNTLTPYIHYNLVFPTSNMKPLISGNYLLVVYENEMVEGQVLLTHRFRVVDSGAGIQVRIPQRPRNLAYDGRKQQLDITVRINGVFNVSPHETVKLVIKQNGRTDNAIYGLRPSHVFGDELTYEYAEETVFDGGNQFRNFDMKSFKYQSERIQRIFRDDHYYVVRLWPDERRHNKNYITEPDLHGRKFIKARDDQDTHIEGDYAWVQFLLHYPAPLTHGEMHIIGSLNDFQLDHRSRMTYNYGLKGYEGALFLKQGYYNYMYGILEPGQNAADISPIEGDHWETLNEYAVMVYFRRPGTTYDQLIGYQTVLSHE